MIFCIGIFGSLVIGVLSVLYLIWLAYQEE